MLVLTRQIDQAIMIGDYIELRVVEVTPTKVRLGITAPREIPIVRSELLDADSEGGGDDDADGDA